MVSCDASQKSVNIKFEGDEAMERLLRCHGQDAYVVLGLRADCSDEDIKRYYKRQAVLVHPDKVGFALLLVSFTAFRIA